MTTPLHDAGPRGAAATFVLGRLSGLLSADDLAGSFERALALLQRACDADDGELILRDPAGEGQLVAASCTPEPPAPVELPATLPDPGDWTDLRGLSCQVTVPLPGPDGDLGFLRLGWRRRDIDVGPARRMLERSAAPIATTLRAGLATLRQSVTDAFAADAHRGEGQRAFLDALRRASGARSATLILSAAATGGQAAVVSTDSAPSVCTGAIREGRLHCPVLSRDRASVLTGPRDRWPESCRDMATSTDTPCCLPLRSGGELRGGVILDYGGEAPTPQGRDIAPLLVMARAAAAELTRPGATADVDDESARGLELRCLGPFEVRVDGRPLPTTAFGRRKAITLLEALILAGGRPVHRDELIERLWPDVEGRTGANRLHGVVHALRTAIEPHGAGRAWTYVCKQGDAYYFDVAAPHTTDIHAFARHTARAGVAARDGRTRDAIDALDRALALYRGDLFDDDPHAEWCERERSSLRQQALDVVARLAMLWIESGEPDRAVDHLRRGLEIDPFREDLHQNLIQTLADLGRRKEAMAQYEDCARLMREELGTDPLPATRRLARLLAATDRRGP